ncbi:hypothetical protein G7Y79_00010g028310 [Physcia stellaris]|nr:hypothetical protein G7Y79_00010g028310 [Physcia stellaris]
MSHARSLRKLFPILKTQNHIEDISSKSLKVHKESSTIPSIKNLLKSRSAIQKSNFKPASVIDASESDEEHGLAKSSVADSAKETKNTRWNSPPCPNTSQKTEARTPSNGHPSPVVKPTTRISRTLDGKITATGAMNFSGSSLFSPENAELLSRIPSGVYEQISIAGSGITLTENGVATFVPRYLEHTFEDSVPLRRSTPYSVIFSDSTSSESKARDASNAATKCGAETLNDKARESPARTEKPANGSSDLPPRAKLEQAYRHQKISNGMLPDKAFFINGRFSGCWGQSLVLRGCHFNNCRFSHSNIANCRFSNSTIEESILIDCTFSGSNVVGGKVIDCDPSNSHIQ